MLIPKRANPAARDGIDGSGPPEITNGSPGC